MADVQGREVIANIERADKGLPAKKTGFNLAAKMEELRAKAEREDNEQVIDPQTIKVRKVQDDMTEAELLEIMQKFGEVTRVKIPKDEDGRSKGIGFATFKNVEDCTKVADEGHIRYDYYELPAERATMSKGQQERM